MRLGGRLALLLQRLHLRLEFRHSTTQRGRRHRDRVLRHRARLLKRLRVGSRVVLRLRAQRVHRRRSTAEQFAVRQGVQWRSSSAAPPAASSSAGRWSAARALLARAQVRWRGALRASRGECLRLRRPPRRQRRPRLGRRAIGRPPTGSRRRRALPARAGPPMKQEFGGRARAMLLRRECPRRRAGDRVLAADERRRSSLRHALRPRRAAREHHVQGDAHRPDVVFRSVPRSGAAAQPRVPARNLWRRLGRSVQPSQRALARVRHGAAEPKSTSSRGDRADPALREAHVLGLDVAVRPARCACRCATAAASCAKIRARRLLEAGVLLLDRREPVSVGLRSICSSASSLAVHALHAGAPRWGAPAARSPSADLRAHRLHAIDVAGSAEPTR